MLTWFITYYVLLVIAVMGVQFVKPYGTSINHADSMAAVAVRVIIIGLLMGFFVTPISHQENEIYKMGQTDALSGEAIYKLEQQDDGRVDWVVTEPYDIRETEDDEKINKELE